MAQSKMMDSRFTEDEKPLLKKWGEMVTCRIFSVNSFVNANMKKSLLQVVESIRYSENPQVCMQQQSIPELLCYLPYLLGFACDTGYLYRIQVDIAKPILVVSNTVADASHLMETISGRQPLTTETLLKSKQILTDTEIANGAHYSSYLITDSNLVSISDVDTTCDVVVCTTDCLPLLCCSDYSLVIGQESMDPALAGFKIYCSVVLLKSSSSSSISPPILTGFSGPPLVHYADMIASGECPMPILLEPQIRGIEEMIDRVTDFKCSHIPIELNICGDKGLKELVYALPCLLGCAVISNSSCLDLHKPVLFLTTDTEAYELVSKAIPVNLPMECKDTKIPDSKGQYQCCLLKCEFDVCTFSQQVNSSEVVLTSTEFFKGKNRKEVIANHLYKNFPSYNLSAVVIVQTKYLPSKKEQEIAYHFRGVTTILIRANAETEKDKQEGHIRVVPKIVTVQQCSAELIYPTLMTHGSDVTERFLLSQKSTLTPYQQVGLANMVEWLGSSYSTSETAYVTTAIGFKYAAMMLWCLPSMLEWADNNQLIPDKAIHFTKPLLILCTKKESVLDIWNMVHSRRAFHQSSLLRSVNTCSDGKLLSYLAADAQSAAKAGSKAGQCKLILSDIGCLDDLPKDAFSQIIVFKEGAMSTSEVNSVSTKFAQKSKIMYFTAHPVGPMMKFELENKIASSVRDDIHAAENMTSTDDKLEKIETQKAASSHTIPPKKQLNSSQVIQEVEFKKKFVANSDVESTPSAANRLEKALTQNCTSQKVQVNKPLLSCHVEQSPHSAHVFQEDEFEEECADIEIITLPPDSTLHEVTNIHDMKEDNLCNAHVQESIVSVQETVHVEMNANPQADKKRKMKWRRALKRKANLQNTHKEDTSDTISTIVKHTECTQPSTRGDMDSSLLKKATKWSKCKQFFRNFSYKNRKGNKRKNLPPNDFSTSQSLNVAEDIGNEDCSSGLFMCWRRRRSNNKRSSTFNSESCEKSDNANRDSASPKTWTDPVVYLSNSRPKITKESPEDVPEETDTLSFASVTLSDPSSLDIISLLERDNTVNHKIASADNPLDTTGKVQMMKSVSDDDLQDIQCVKALSCGSRVSHPNAIEHCDATILTVTEDFMHSEPNTTAKKQS